MYAKLGPHWAGTLLGLVQVAIIPIPVVFWRYGGRIRMKSALISSMQKDKERLEGKRASAVARREKQERELERVGSGIV